jgi:glucose-6-phosphate isomerase
MATSVQKSPKSARIRSLTRRPAWKALQNHFKAIRSTHLRALFAEDPGRGKRMTVEAAGLFLDYSKNRVTNETLALLLQLAEESGLRRRIDAMLTGEKINITEKRAGVYVTLRPPRSQNITLDGENVVPAVHVVLDKMTDFATACSAAIGRVTGRSVFAVWSTLASAAQTLARSWPTRRSNTTLTAP